MYEFKPINEGSIKRDDGREDTEELILSLIIVVRWLTLRLVASYPIRQMNYKVNNYFKHFHQVKIRN